MLVEVVQLYWRGEKLSREARRQVKPVRGQLTVDRLWTHAHMDNPAVHADLMPYRLETLQRVRLRYWRGRNVVLSGLQRDTIPGSKDATVHYEQWWWCRIVAGG